MAAFNRYAVDPWGDGVDSNCDGIDGIDIDGDGEAGRPSGGPDCDDLDPAIDSSTDGDADGLPFCEGDCDDSDPAVGSTGDGDGDGLSACSGDCRDDLVSVRPGVTEICDGLDTDCDGSFAGEEDADGDQDPACSDCDDGDGGRDGLDGDGDGVSSCQGDCEDDIAVIQPYAQDPWGDGFDTNCDGIDGFDLDNDGEAGDASGGPDCDDLDAAVLSSTDSDGDGTTLCAGDCDDDNPAMDTTVDADGDGLSGCAGDCRDDLAWVHPGAPELCDGLDSDCDGAFPGEEDADGDQDPACSDCDDGDGGVDGLDVDGDGVSSCEGDCFDTVATVNPYAPDPWGDGADSNCDGIDGVDLDGDGEAGSASGGPDCEDLDATVSSGTDADGDGVSPCEGDCDDGDAIVHPGAPELCDGVDGDCDSTIPGEGDVDGDGTLTCADCDDGDAGRWPGALDSYGDGVDQDCDGADGVDGDGDGFAVAGGDCDDGNANVYPTAPDTFGDGWDQDCDGADGEDQDGDGFSIAAGDCDDAYPSWSPAAPDAYGDGVDTNCDGSDGVDGDGDGYAIAAGDCDDSDPLPCELVAVSAGYDMSCAILDTGALRCWGSNYYGQLGPGRPWTLGNYSVPAIAGDIPLDGVAVGVTSGFRHTCVLLDTGAVRCWGNNQYGQLGTGTMIGGVDVALGGVATQIAAGSYHTCAVLDTGGLRCWGQGVSGQLGYASTASVGDDETPASVGDVQVGGSVLQVSAGFGHTCALLVGGTVRCWGLGTLGRLGYGNTDTIGDDEVPAVAGDLSLGGAAMQVAVGWGHACALLGSGALRCWGHSLQGALGYGNQFTIGDDEDPSWAGDVPVGGTVVAVAAGLGHTCAILEAGAVRCWGYGRNGELGSGATNNIGDDEIPAQAGDVPTGGSAAALALGGSHTCALFDMGQIRCWGNAYYGQLGYGNMNGIGDNEWPSAVGYVQVALPSL